MLHDFMYYYLGCKLRREKIVDNQIRLTADRQNEIESIVDRIIEENGIDIPGFDLVSFLKEKKGFIIGIKAMDDDTTGILAINDDKCIVGDGNHKVIAVNSRLRYEPDFFQRRRYIIAHEYAHSELHKQSNSLYAHRDTSKKNTVVEKEADFFARCLLMPRKLIYEALNVEYAKDMKKDEKISLVSRTFNVTEKKAKIRYEELFESEAAR